MRALATLAAFLRRDFLTQVSYRLAFLLQIAGLLFSLAAFYFLSKMIDPGAAGLNGIRPFEYILVGVAFLGYFSTALYAFSNKIREEQMMGTLEAMLVTPARTSQVIFFSAAWDFAYGGIRLVLYLLFATFVFGVTLHVASPLALGLGILLTLVSSAGIGFLSASFILYFKRGNPINFLLSGVTTFFGTAFFPVEQLPAWIRGFADYVPLTWSLRVVRGALLQDRTFADLSHELFVLFVLTLVVVPFGLFAARFAIRSAKREGSLVQY
jgi:ABC-2 type transport system permease protein